MMRSPARASASIFRYRGSKMCRGRNTDGKRTTLGSGKIGIVDGSIMVLGGPRRDGAARRRAPPGARGQCTVRVFLSRKSIRT